MLTKSMPNLIVCPQVDVLKTVIHMYMHNPDQPLPRPDEVLLCNFNTSIDQVDGFLRRAFFASQGKLHCLVNADLLNFEVGEKTEKKLKEYEGKTGEGYQLLVVCSGENEYRARIVAALDRHRCHPPVVSNAAIRAYLQKKFSSTSTRHGVQSASHVDFDGSTVRVVKSKRAGVGKTLYKRRLVERLHDLNGSTEQRGHPLSVSVPLCERRVCTNSIAQTLLKHTCLPEEDVARIFHFDISYDVQDGVDAFLFNLLVLGCITSDAGLVWLRSPMDLYVIETIPLVDTTHKPVQGVPHLMHNMLDVLPEVQCWSPQESLHILEKSYVPREYLENDQLFDKDEFRSEIYQRPYQYLKRFDENKSLSGVNASKAEGGLADGLKVLLRHCGIPDPSWAELRHFICFLNTQLADFEMSSFCGVAAAEDLPGFAKFLLRFLFQMSRDFATRSLQMAEESPLAARAAVQEEREDGEDAALELFQMRRTWESSPHPYIFFNPDGHSMTFLGFNIDQKTGNLVDHQTGAVLEKAIMDKALQESLHRNRVPLSENFDALNRGSRITRLASVIGLDYVFDPDETYELTTDNVKKMLAIYMRFRCGIPVIIMGETGCGKTRLVKFLCQLQAPPGVEVNNMVLMKVHGGTTAADITRKVQAAEELARHNAQKFGAHMYTVLFFDEANSTEAIGLIKEILCDGSMGGRPLALSNNLKMVAACNPYRKHSEELIKRLEKAGLGYHVDADQTVDLLGRVPMRRLVYRVQPLPQSMLPLVWDFGQLRTDMEEKYIRQMVSRYVRNGRLPNTRELVEVLSRILIGAQEFMRRRNDECSFVSLRDVERTLLVMGWFYSKAEKPRALFNIIDPMEPGKQKEEEKKIHSVAKHEPKGKGKSRPGPLPFESVREKLPDDLTKSAILALAVCYRACLQNRGDFDEAIAAKFQRPLQLPLGVHHFRLTIIRAQKAIMDNVMLEENIAKNHALSENVFMMVVCTELRIPLFLVGKPGSSKSLAKTIVADAMQGNSARFPLFRNLKQTHMMSFQCSPLSTADGIVGTFRQCAQIQKDKNLDTFVSVVVLDEVGLAEDSPKMPLKTLHPLLEDGCQGDENPEPYKKVAFMGISNWALDPAKMNRGILVQRDVPDEEELINSAEGICASNPRVTQIIRPLVRHLATGYLKIFETAQTKREFFGLRDYYSLVKMICGFAAKTGRMTCWHQLEHSIRRNFGGLDHINPVDIFSRELPAIPHHEKKCHNDDPDCDASRLIEAGLFGDDLQSESRYLLLLTENYGALNILQQQVFASHDAAERTGQRRHVVPQTIFGSSFPKDQEYTQICRNINKIKVCMETGHTVILLNLENLYESLYDALNQYYAKLGEERYVDLGLGTHRVKCRVHKEFRLIVVAEKQVVYNKFPIPLINRLEKHFLTLSNLMSPLQLRVAEQLHQWATKFATPRQPPPLHQRQRQEPKPGDVFMGYHPDATAALVLQHWDSSVDQDHPDQSLLEEISRRCRNTLLECATPDAVVRLKDSQLSQDELKLWHAYFEEQQHESLLQYLHHLILVNKKDCFFAQVTTHSKLLTDGERLEMAEHLCLQPQSAVLLTLQSFDTEQQFSQQIRNFVSQPSASGKLLLVQCNSGHNQMDLLKCAQYSVVDALPSSLRDFYVIFIVQLPRIAGDCFSGFQAGKWHSLHIDDLRQQGKAVPSFLALKQLSPSALLQSAMPGQHLTPQRVESQPGPAEDDLSATAKNVDGENVSVERKEGLFLEDKIPKVREASEQPALLRVEKPGGQACFDPESFRQLILSCLQAAVAMVQDDDPKSQRPMERIGLLLSLISPDSPQCQPPFMSGLCGLITKLLKEKEDTIVGQDGARDWLAAEAARVDRVKEAGTFRRAWVQCLESKVTPILGGIVAFLDTHRNLDLVVQGQPWQRDLWLAVLLSPETCDLHYASLTSPQKQREATKMAPHTTTAHGATFAVQLPFSWLLLQPLDALLSQNSNTDKQLEKMVSSIQNMPFCRLLMSVTEDSEKDIIKAYVHDFIRSKYKLRSEQGYILLCETLVAACHQMGQQILAMPLPRTLVALHWVHREAEARLHSFLSIERVWPQVIDSYLNRDAAIWQQGDPPLSRLDSTEELTLDVAGLYLLLNELEPQKDQLNTARGRQQWLTKVTKFSPILTSILNTLDSATPECGPRCRIFLEKVRGLWTRVLAMKLFVDHFFPANSQIVLEIACMPFWVFLGPKANLKTLQTLDKVEQYLKTVNKNVLRSILGELPKCPECETDSDAPLLNLPCKHRICVRCFQDMCAQQELACPMCQHAIPAGFAEDRARQIQREDLAKFEEYQRRCNSFLMALVAKLCFAGDSVPEPAAVERILGYVMRKSRSGETLQTKQLTLFDNLVDPSPVVRSFLLQLLIRKREEDTKKHLEEFFSQAQRHCLRRGGAGDSNEDRDLREFALLVLHCLEDMYHEIMPKGFVELTEYVTKHLEAARENLLLQVFDLAKVSALARCRQGLEVVADLIHGVEVAGSLPLNREEQDVYQKLLKAARALVDVNTDWPRCFLLKQLCRESGLESYYSLVTKKAFSWLMLGDNTRAKQCQDRFLVCGRDYQQLRDTVATILLGKDVTTLEKAMKAVAGEQEVRERAALLALCRCVTMSFLQPDAPSDRTKVLAIKALGKFLEKSPSITQKELIPALLGNRLGRAGSPLVLAPGRSLGEQSLVAWLLHFRLLLSRNHRLLLPLSALALQPHTMQNALLPTMPEDNTNEVFEILLSPKNARAGNTATYSCPSGHYYVIGECGRPMNRGTCIECGASIGGKEHIPDPGNVKHKGQTWQDRTETGYILGPAAQRSVQAVPERSLTPGACSLLRLLTHAALLLGAGTNSQAVTNMVKPLHRAGVEGMEKFFWDHLMKDLEVLQKCLGKSVDDIFSLLHCLVEAMWEQRNAGRQTPFLDNKLKRSQWETDMDTAFLAPAIQRADASITRLNETVAQDKNMGQDRLLCLMYEVGSPPSHLPPDSLHLDPAVWRYRERITVAHFFQRLDLEQKAGASLEVLCLFRKECHILQALCHVPELLQFQRLLLSLYHRRLDRSEALKISIWDLLNRSGDQGVRLLELLELFCQVWEEMKGYLLTYGCWTSQTVTVNLPEAERSVMLTPNSPCAFFLPTTRGPGLVAYILTEFLLRRHNRFMEEYCSITRSRYEDLAEVQLRNLTASHLVCLELERDLLPLVLANCNYSFQMGKGTQVEYDFHGFQRELVEQFLQSKARVHQQHHVIPIETMSYRDDTTAAVKLKALKDRLPQEPLSPASRHQISSQLPGLPEICQCLSDLDVAISFLQSLGGEPGLALHSYMVDVLRMAPNTLCSQKARQVCQLKHVQSLWLLLCFERAKILAHYREEAFDSLGQELQAELKPEQKAALGEFCQDQRLSLEKLECLLQQLFDCILLRIAQSATSQEGEDEAFDLSEQKLRDVLMTDLEELLDDENRERLPVAVEDLASFPEDIKGSQASRAWLCIFHNIGVKKKQLF